MQGSWSRAGAQQRTRRFARRQQVPRYRSGWQRELLVDRRLRVGQQRDDVLDLLLGEDALVAEARHVRAGRERLRVVDLAVRVLACVVGVSAQLAELVER